MRDLHCKAMPFRPADNSPFRRHYAPMGATRRSLLCLCMCDGFSIAHRRENARIIAEAPPVAEKARRFRGSVPVFTPQGGWKPADTTVFRIAEAPPVAEKARRFRGSVPVFTPQRGWKPADTTVFRIAEAPPVAYFSQQFFFCLRRHTFCQQRQKVCKKRRQKPMVSGLPFLSRTAFVMGRKGNRLCSKPAAAPSQMKERVGLPLGEYGSPPPVCGLVSE